jgi:predicted ABC-type ATPase
VSGRPGGQIVVIAGVNGAGKSSIAGARVGTSGLVYWNPDAETQKLLRADPSLSIDDANAAAWPVGKELLEEFCTNDGRLLFETTLGGRTITEVLDRGARGGKRIRIVYVGLATMELHIQRVARRVASGGHDVPEERIRERYRRSPENLIYLLPLLDGLELFDNSQEVGGGRIANPLHIMSCSARLVDLSLPGPEVPYWAMPIVQAARNLETR